MVAPSCGAHNRKYIDLQKVIAVTLIIEDKNSVEKVPVHSTFTSIQKHRYVEVQASFDNEDGPYIADHSPAQLRCLSSLMAGIQDPFVFQPIDTASLIWLGKLVCYFQNM